jgi:hypothetical protein
MTEINDRGNAIYRGPEADSRIGGRGSDRYGYDADLCATRKGWRQFDTDQDACYFGFWVNVQERKTFTYCEGDRILVECPTRQSFIEELRDAETFYGAAPPAFICFGMNGSRAEYFDPRPSV